MVNDGGDGSSSRHEIWGEDSTAALGDSTASFGDGSASAGDSTASDGSSSTEFGNPEGRDRGTGRGLTPHQEEDESDSLFWEAVSYVTGAESQGLDTLAGSFWSTDADEYGSLLGQFFSGEPNRGGDKPLTAEYPSEEENARYDGGQDEERRGVTRRGLLQAGGSLGLAGLGSAVLGGSGNKDDSREPVPAANGTRTETTTPTTAETTETGTDRTTTDDTTKTTTEDTTTDTETTTTETATTTDPEGSSVDPVYTNINNAESWDSESEMTEDSPSYDPDMLLYEGSGEFIGAWDMDAIADEFDIGDSLTPNEEGWLALDPDRKGEDFYAGWRGTEGNEVYVDASDLKDFVEEHRPEEVYTN
jgi:hypothetical protein